LLAKCLEKAGRHQHAVEQYRQAVQIAESVERNTVLVAEIQAGLSALLKRIQE
jgi:Tfp pilus assembly protein PilF